MASTPVIRISGLIALAAMAMPEMIPPAADRHDDVVEIGRRREQFQPGGTLTGDDRRVVVGVNHGQPVFGRETLGMHLTLAEAFTE